jgi:hypothetical protein
MHFLGCYLEEVIHVDWYSSKTFVTASKTDAHIKCFTQRDAFCKSHRTQRRGSIPYCTSLTESQLAKSTESSQVPLKKLTFAELVKNHRSLRDLKANIGPLFPIVSHVCPNGVIMPIVLWHVLISPDPCLDTASGHWPSSISTIILHVPPCLVLSLPSTEHYAYD